MTEERQALGRWGEQEAATFLKRKGLRILERNLRTPVGEIDILARSRRELVFIEVKTRRGVTYGLPAEAVGPRKQRQILRAAQWYMAENGMGRLQPRFDVVAVFQQADGQSSIQHLESAFDAEVLADA